VLLLVVVRDTKVTSFVACALLPPPQPGSELNGKTFKVELVWNTREEKRVVNGETVVSPPTPSYMTQAAPHLPPPTWKCQEYGITPSMSTY
jgi:hypothetical protein